MKCEQEKKLVTRFKSGDADAFGMLFKLYAPKLGSFCLGLVSKEDAENIVQDVFLKLWETRKKIDPSQNFGMYTMTIARNLIYDIFRRKLVSSRYVLKLQPLLEESVSTWDELNSRDRGKFMLCCIERLPKQQREVMLLKIKDFDNEEIAKLLGLSKRTVETHLNKAYKKLRIDLNEIRFYLFYLSLLFH